MSGHSGTTVEPPPIGEGAEPRVLRPGNQNTFGAVLRNGPFLRLWLAQVLSMTANNMVNFALLLRVTDIVTFHQVAGANTAVSLVILSFSIPSVLFGPVAGVAADRTNRRTLMTLVNLGRAVSVFLFLVIRPTWHAQTVLVAIYLITFLFGTISQFFAPAEGATIPALVPRDQLIAANSLFNLTFTATQLLGFAVFGPVLAKLVGLDVLFAVCVVLFVLCAGLTATLPSSSPTARKDANGEQSMMRRLWEDVREGLVYILQDPMLLRAIVNLTIASTTFMMVASLGPEFVTKVIGLTPNDIGYIVAPAGLGVVLGVLLVPTLVRRFPREQVIDWSILLGGVMLLLIALSRIVLEALLGGPPPVALLTAVAGSLAGLLGVCNACVLVPAQTILQERSHDQIRARVYATFFTISNTVAFIPIFFAAASADIFGVVQVLAVVALLLTLIGVVSLVKRRADEESRRGRVPRRHRQGPEAIGPRD